VRWDAREDYEAPKDPDRWDDALIGEDKDGIWARVHPAALLEREAPWLEAVIRQFFGTSDRELRAGDYTGRAARWRTIWAAMLAARRRQDVKDAESEGEKRREEAAKRGGR